MVCYPLPMEEPVAWGNQPIITVIQLLFRLGCQNWAEFVDTK